MAIIISKNSIGCQDRPIKLYFHKYNIDIDTLKFKLSIVFDEYCNELSVLTSTSTIITFLLTNKI